MDVATSGIPLSSCWIVSLVILSIAVRSVIYFEAPSMTEGAIDRRDSVKTFRVAAEYERVGDIVDMFFAYCWNNFSRVEQPIVGNLGSVGMYM